LFTYDFYQKIGKSIHIFNAYHHTNTTYQHIAYPYPHTTLNLPHITYHVPYTHISHTTFHIPTYHIPTYHHPHSILSLLLRVFFYCFNFCVCRYSIILPKNYTII
jgi:hypothetical protein